MTQLTEKALAKYKDSPLVLHKKSYALYVFLISFAAIFFLFFMVLIAASDTSPIVKGGVLFVALIALLSIFVLIKGHYFFAANLSTIRFNPYLTPVST